MTTLRVSIQLRQVQQADLPVAARLREPVVVLGPQGPELYIGTGTGLVPLRLDILANGFNLPAAGIPTWEKGALGGVAPLGEDGRVPGAYLPDAAPFQPSGEGHAPGLVPDPGADPGATRFLREDGLWVAPPAPPPPPFRGFQFDVAARLPVDRLYGRAVALDARYALQFGTAGGSAQLLRYDRQEDRWEALTPAPVSDTSNVPITLGADGALYVLGTQSSRVLRYDPGADAWEVRGAAVPPSDGADAVLLTTGPHAGSLLVVGTGATITLYDPVSDMATPMPGPATGGSNGCACRMADGRVFSLGGHYTNGAARILDPVTWTWSAVAEAGWFWESRLVATPSGDVVAIGGYANETVLRRWHHGENLWANVPAPMVGHWRQNHAVAQFPDGVLLVAGGSFSPRTCVLVGPLR